MGDFQQEGIITTLHGLYEAFDRAEYLEGLERKLEQYAQHSKISLLLPSLHSEIENPEVLDRILGEIQQVRYLHNVVVALGGATEESRFQEAREYFGRLRTPERDVKIIWVDGPRIQQIFRNLQEKEMHISYLPPHNTRAPCKPASECYEFNNIINLQIASCFLDSFTEGLFTPGAGGNNRLGSR